MHQYMSLMTTSRTYVVVGVEHTGDVLCQISVQHSLDVISNINYRQLNAF